MHMLNISAAFKWDLRVAANVPWELHPKAPSKGLMVNEVHLIRSHYRVFALQFKWKDLAWHDLS